MAITFEQLQKGRPISEAIEQKPVDIGRGQGWILGSDGKYYEANPGYGLIPGQSKMNLRYDPNPNTIPWTPILIGVGAVALIWIIAS